MGLGLRLRVRVLGIESTVSDRVLGLGSRLW